MICIGYTPPFSQALRLGSNAHARMMVPSRRSPLEDESGTIGTVSIRTDGHDIALDGDGRSEIYVVVTYSSNGSIRPDKRAASSPSP